MAIHRHTGLVSKIFWRKAFGIVGLVLCLPLFGTLVTIEQVSEPVGFLSKTTVVGTGASLTTEKLELSKNGYYFSYWEKAGTKLSDSKGRSLTQPTIEVDAAFTLTAHYIHQSEDSDGDGIFDWFEYRKFGNLAELISSDPDGDGYTNGQEQSLGQDPTISDLVEDGGISSRRSIDFVFADKSLVHYEIKSEPIGFVDTTSGYAELNATVATPNLNGKTNGYLFAYWSVNGVRQASTTGKALSRLKHKLTSSANIVAHYLTAVEDSDHDGLLDVSELNQFGDLSQVADADADSDGFTNQKEDALGQESTVKDFVEDGGISSRQSKDFVFGDFNLVHYQIDSEPVGFINKSSGYVQPSTIVSTPSLYGEANGYRFAYWSVNGTRQASPNGIALSKLDLTLLSSSKIIAHYVRTLEDTDSDGIKDWMELHRFGQLDQDSADDADLDGFNNAQEVAAGQEPTIKDLVEDGGISSRQSIDFTYFVQGNRTPNGTTLSNNVFFANQPGDLLVGTLKPIDYDDPNQEGSYSYDLVDGPGSTDNGKFNLTGNKLETGRLIPEGNFSIRIRITDSNSAFAENIFQLKALLNGNSDNDSDGLTLDQEKIHSTNPNLADTDGDSYSDLMEVNFGSDPNDPSSVPNQAPHGLQLSENKTWENQIIGITIGTFSTSDSDANDSHSYAFIEGNGSTDNSLFSVDANGTLKTSSVLDFETSPILSIRVKATDLANESIEKVFPIQVLNVSVPIADTLPIQNKEGDIYQLTGKIFSNGEANITGYGFELDVSLKFENPKVFAGFINSETQKFSASTDLLEKGKSFYYRAFATNQEGSGYGSPIRFSTTASLTEWWVQAPEHSNGWRNSSWFGVFLPFDNGWAYHVEWGWIFVQDDQQGGIWLWKEGFGWQWTTKDIYPYLYRNNSAIWMYFLKKKNGILHFYNHNTKQVE